MHNTNIIHLFLKYILCVFIAAYAAMVHSSEKQIHPVLCSLAGVGELFVPGLGYAISGQYSKAAGFGLTRLYFSEETERLMAKDDYQISSGDYYHERTISQNDINTYDYLKQEDKGQSITYYSYNKSTFDVNFLETLNFNLGLYSYWDLTSTNCQPNPHWTEPFFALADYKTYGTNPLFLGGLGFLALAAVEDPEGVSVWHLGEGLTMAEVQQKSLLMHYGVGIGEETAFRGSIQKSFYNQYKKSFSPHVAHHLGIFSAAFLFGIAHDGQVGSATPWIAFLSGVYLGYTYQPKPEVFELSSSIMLHALVNITSVYGSIREAREVKHLPKGERASTSKSLRDIPLVRVSIPF